MQLSWDLHVHPGPADQGRWGDHRRVWAAASDAGLAGFVWKEHARRIEADAALLPAGGARCLPSLVMNTWASAADVAESLAAGVQWYWGPTRDADQRLRWDLDLPGWWPEARELLLSSPRPVVLSTGHLNSAGRRELARTAAAGGNLRCSVTHSRYLREPELRELVGLGCALEYDLFTASFPIAGRPERSLAAALCDALELGGIVYLTTDAGQHAVGNPFDFAAAKLIELERSTSTGIVREAARTGPSALAGFLADPGAAT
jgi:hypothetical protein